jgi:phenylalanyl-tRNA synthetase beta chain
VYQIVCGASNVRAGIYIALATIGAKLPDGLEIKEAKLRGVESYGMICSSKEIGLPAMGEGIMILDKSIGELVLGKNLNTYALFNDDIIEIELTANRGDCLSIYGIARDLRAAFEKPLRQKNTKEKLEGRLGMGRILQLHHGDVFDADLRFGAVDLKELSTPLQIALRLALVGEVPVDAMNAFLMYATHSSGVILRAYPFSKISHEPKGVITLANDENGYASMYGEEKLSVLGLSQLKESHFEGNTGLAIIEASYIHPEIIARKMGEHKIPSCPHYYRASRGSEPRIEMGIDFFMGLMESYSASVIYGGTIELQAFYEPRIISIAEEEFEQFIGLKIDKTTITQICKHLEMIVGTPKGSTFSLTIPRFRHDIVNKQDVIEEIVRMVGIDNIPAKPLLFAQNNQMGSDLDEYKKTRSFRHRAAQSGFYESVHFVFNERLQVEKYGFVCTDIDKELLNPITATFDTLRPTLLMGLLNSASANVKVNQKKIALFESGMVFDSKRNESKKIAFVISGAFQNEKISNAGKPPIMDFGAFTQLVSNVIGTFELAQHVPTHTLAHPYMCAKVMIGDVQAGEIFRVHPKVEEEFDLPHTFMCELCMDALPFSLIEAVGYSKYQASFRDLSLLVPKALSYSVLKNVIEKHRTAEIVRFYPVDRYVSEALGDHMSLTLRFVLQSVEKTLEEEDISAAMASILNGLSEELGVCLR